MFLIRLFYLSYLLSNVFTAANAEPISAQTIIEEAASRQLHKHRIWLTILGYESNQLFDASPASVYQSNDSFLSSSGKNDAQLELEHTLASFYQEAGPFSDEHPQCRFRARFEWLNQELALVDKGLRLIQCESYDNWKQVGATRSISVLFVGGFLGNPASYYGHNMIKLNSDSAVSTDLQNRSVNFGANIPQEDGIFKYIVRGITGGYTGVFSSAEFLHYANNYGQIENRDIWEYELNLSDSELSLMLALIWELMNVDYTYYFFNRNCAYRMAKLFDAFRGLELTGGTDFWYSPQTFIQRMATQHGAREIFTSNIQFHPSRQTAFYSKYYDLDVQERRLVDRVARHPDDMDDKFFETAPLESKIRVLDVLLDYYQYTATQGQSNIVMADSPYNRVLARRLVLPPGESSFAATNPDSPHVGRRMSYISATLSESAPTGRSVRLRLRPAYYDSVDYSAGHVQAASLSMGDLDIQFNQRGVVIRQLSLLKIESINMLATGLPGDDRQTWLLEAGAVQDRIDDPHSAVARIRGQIGYAFPAIDRRGVYGVRLGGSFQSRYRGSDKLLATATAFFTYEFSALSRLHLLTEFWHGMGDDSKSRRVDKLLFRRELSTNVDLRMAYEKNIASEFSIGVGVYW